MSERPTLDCTHSNVDLNVFSEPSTIVCLEEKIIEATIVTEGTSCNKIVFVSFLLPLFEKG